MLRKAHNNKESTKLLAERQAKHSQYLPSGISHQSQELLLTPFTNSSTISEQIEQAQMDLPNAAAECNVFQPTSSSPLRRNSSSTAPNSLTSSPLASSDVDSLLFDMAHNEAAITPDIKNCERRRSQRIKTLNETKTRNLNTEGSFHSLYTLSVYLY